MGDKVEVKLDLGVREQKRVIDPRFADGCEVVSRPQGNSASGRIR
jgi:hypothetical protein